MTNDTKRYLPSKIDNTNQDIINSLQKYKPKPESSQPSVDLDQIQDSSEYAITKEFIKNIGFDYTSTSCKVKTKNGYTHVNFNNLTTKRVYEHLYKGKTISLPQHSPTYNKMLIFDIDDNQASGLSVDKAVEVIRKDWGFGFFSELRTGSSKKGAHLYYQCESEVFEEAKEYLITHYKRKGVLLETRWDYLRLPYSDVYQNGAIDQNGAKVVNQAHVTAIFATKDSFITKIPAFLKPFNKPGHVIQKQQKSNSSGTSIDNIIISRGQRSDEMVILALYAVGENMSIEQYTDLCDSHEDSSNPSRGLHDSHREQTIKSIYNWAEENHNPDFKRSENNGKSKIFKNESELELSIENFNHIPVILRRTGKLDSIKYAKVQNRTIWGVQCMMEGILSMQDFQKKNPREKYTDEYAILNDGFAIAQSTVKLIAEYYGIKNWIVIWNIVKELFLKAITLASGFSYSYCNVRHAIHWRITSIVSLFNSLFTFNSTPNIRKSINTNRRYYNICMQVSSNTDSWFPAILNNNDCKPRAGPLIQLEAA